MKRIIAVIVCVVMIAALFAACSGAPAAEDKAAVKEAVTEAVGEAVTEAAEEAGEAVAEAVAANQYCFAADGVELRIYDDADAAIEALGDPLQTFEADSCAYQGKDYFYYYDGFQLTVNDIDGAKVITGIKLVDDTVAMPEGIAIGSSEDEVTDAYGEDYTKDGSVYVYDDGVGQLRIKAENGTVTSVEILAVAEGENE